MNVDGFPNTYARPGASSCAPVDPVVELRVGLQMEVHGAGVRGQLASVFLGGTTTKRASDPAASL